MIPALIYFNFVLYLIVFAISLSRNGNFNTILVGLTYMAPLVPLGMTPGNEARFLIVSLLNTIFGIIELVIFVRTVKPGDVKFDAEFFQQLLQLFPDVLDGGFLESQAEWGCHYQGPNGFS